MQLEQLSTTCEETSQQEHESRSTVYEYNSVRVDGRAEAEMSDARCTRLCSQVCARDGVCRDGGRGQHVGMRPACAYGSDCADCGVRTQCSPEGTSFEVETSFAGIPDEAVLGGCIAYGF